MRGFGGLIVYVEESDGREGAVGRVRGVGGPIVYVGEPGGRRLPDGCV